MKARDFALKKHGIQHSIHLDAIAKLIMKLDWYDDLLPLAFLHDITTKASLSEVASEFGDDICKKIHNLISGKIKDPRLACVACADMICHLSECDTVDELADQISKRSELANRISVTPIAGWLWSDMVNYENPLPEQPEEPRRRSRRTTYSYSIPAPAMTWGEWAVGPAEQAVPIAPIQGGQASPTYSTTTTTTTTTTSGEPVVRSSGSSSSSSSSDGQPPVAATPSVSSVWAQAASWRENLNAIQQTQQQQSIQEEALLNYLNAQPYIWFEPTAPVSTPIGPVDSE